MKPTLHNLTKLNEFIMIILRALKAQVKTFCNFIFHINFFWLFYLMTSKVGKIIIFIIIYINNKNSGKQGG